MPNKILIYDSQSSTHLAEYLEYCIDFFNLRGVENEYVFLVNKKIIDLIDSSLTVKNVTITPIDIVRMF